MDLLSNSTHERFIKQAIRLAEMGARLEEIPVGAVVVKENNIIGDAVTNEIGTTVYGRRLFDNPIVLTNSSAVAKVKHRDHGMYSTSNNVTITGASSLISTIVICDPAYARPQAIPDPRPRPAPVPNVTLFSNLLLLSYLL